MLRLGKWVVLKMKMKNDDIIVSFLGKSKEGVTGTCISISYLKDDNTRGLVIIECGLCQEGHNVKERYNNNKNMLDEIGKDVVKNCECILLSHCHIDHIGNLPFFNEDNGFNGVILGSEATLRLSEKLIKDSLYIHQKDIDYLKLKGNKVKALYTEPQMYQMFRHMHRVIIGQKIKINDNLTVEFHRNSHVIGATSISIYIKKPSGVIKHILYSGDMGSSNNKCFENYLYTSHLPHKCNLFITEATYNNKERQFTKIQAKKEREWLKEYIEENLKTGKRILFPTFAFARSQQLVTDFYKWFKDEDWFKDFPIYMDGKLMNEINRTYFYALNDVDTDDSYIFEEIMHWRNIRKIENYKGTKAILSERNPGIYLAGSGFMEAGRITTYLPTFIPKSNDCIVITGYCGSDVGNQVVDNNLNLVKITKKEVYVKNADIHQLYTYSSHIQYSELLKLFASMKCDKIIVHHSDESNKQNFVNEAKEYMMSKGITTRIIAVSEKKDQFTL